jgi:endonuclease III related protein
LGTGLVKLSFCRSKHTMRKSKNQQLIIDVYGRLFAYYGPQHWWPAEEPFEMIVGAILTQSAAWTNVEKAVVNLKKAGALSPKALRRLPEAELAQLIFPTGYYNAKARKLKAFAEYFGSKYNDSLEKLLRGEVNELRNEFLSVYGIGEETADSILLYAGHKPIFVIDAYTRRIAGRLGLKPAGEKYPDYQRLFMEALPPDAQLFNEYHALLVRLGKEACRKKPDCAKCCLNQNKRNTNDISTSSPCARDA